ncbi:MAG: pyridoxal-phosphate dependent enzyme [Desulfovibrio sp.]|jgi:1-aminocyclopropane-1-carboxylate deaminase/D-cysteine desulfhydrase-like pyridoxal-dependent ACC family enzyme|nr:pyridoxal-phosphate dependent enzyme [Desulfovibrio sp.]
MTFADLKKVDIVRFPTPLDPMPALSARLCVTNLHIKRDDLAGPALSGNKIRKIEYYVREALDLGYTTVLTHGAAQSNHARLTAAAAAKCGLKSVLLLKGDRPLALSGNLLLNRLLGSEMRFYGREDSLEATITTAVTQCRARGEKVYVIPLATAKGLGVAGYMHIAAELAEQVKELPQPPKDIVCAVGSLGTFAGLWLGIRHYGAPFRVTGISVNPATMPSLAKAAALVNEASCDLGLGIRCEPGELDIVFHTPETPYACVDNAGPVWEHIRLLAETEAVFLDPGYTGKAFYGFVDLLGKGRFADGAIFYHSGGTPGLFAAEHVAAANAALWTEEEATMQ